MNRLMLAVLVVTALFAANAGAHSPMVDQSATVQSENCAGDMRLHLSDTRHSGQDTRNFDCSGCGFSISCCPSFPGSESTSQTGQPDPALSEGARASADILHIPSLIHGIYRPPRRHS